MKTVRNLALGAFVAVAFGAFGSLSSVQASPFGTFAQIGAENALSISDVQYRRRRVVRRNNAIAGAIVGAAIVGGIAAIAVSEQRRRERRAYYYDAYGRPVYAQPSYGYVDEPVYAPQYAPQTYYAPNPGYYYAPGRPGYVGGHGYDRRAADTIRRQDPSSSLR